MKRLLTTVFAIGVAVLLAVGVNSWAKDPPHGGAKGGKVLTVIEHATTDAVTDTGDSGDSAGDLLTFANPIFDASDKKQVGTDQGYCVRTVPGVAWECNFTTFLPRGQIVVEGPFYDARGSTFAITGGTGRYRNARGTMKLESLEGGAKFTLTFRIIG
jgi:allene oxide cyclase